MKTIVKKTAIAIILVLLSAVDIPLLPVQLVPEAQAIFGVRRRTAVIAYSAGAATATAANQASASSQQQAAPAPQQAAPAPPPQAPPAQPASAVPVGTIVKTLPEKCIPVTIGNVQYQDCGGSFYRTAFQGNNLVYVVVDKPL